MIRTLIICSNFEIAKRLINKILYKIDDVKIIGIMSRLKPEVIDRKINLIITSNKNIVYDVLDNKHLSSVKIIFISFYAIKLFENKNLLEFNYFSSDTAISNSITYFINTKFNNPSKKKVIKILKNLGFDFKLVGTLYLVESIMYIHSFKGYSFETLYRDVYPYIANINNTTINRIKWSIERSIRYLYNKNNEKDILNIYNYFGVKYPDKITSKMIINFIANSLQEL